jgi:hypothetical protein
VNRAGRLHATTRLSAAVALTIGSAMMLGLAVHAQSTPGTKLVIVMRYGDTHKLHVYGWRGITKDAVRGHPGVLYQRPYVRYVCRDQCPENLPAKDIPEDTVVWASGPATKGDLESVSCSEQDVCVVSQKGQPQRAFGDAKYIQFSAPSR